MDPKGPAGMWLAPSASSGAALRFPARNDPPPVDLHVVRPEVTRDEVVRGRKVYAQPALEPHGDQHFRLDYILGGYVTPGYVGSTDLLTRSATDSDFATDTCIRKVGIDPRTNRRYLEEVAFEVVNEQSPKDIAERAEDLVARGVRRVFAIFVKKGEVREWSAAARAWTALGPGAVIEDPCLCRPLAASALITAAADDAVARALVEKDNPVIAQAKEEARAAAQLVMLGRMFEKRLGRALTDVERVALVERRDRLGVEPLEDACLGLAGEALAAWLAG